MTTSIIRSLTTRTSLTCVNSAYRNASTISADNCGVYDLVVVGGGILGCATAREMKIRHPNLNIALVEKEDIIAKHQTGHNSGVIHAGIYYKPGSMKAKLCVKGLDLMYDYVCKNDIPHNKVGKLIVAHSPQQVPQLEQLFERGIENNCKDIELVEKDCISNYEAECQGEKAIWSPWTGIVDYGEVCRHFAEDFKQMGGVIYLNFEVAGFAEPIESKNKEELSPICLYSKNKYLSTKHVLTCAGLHSDRLAVMTGCGLSPRIVPFRGEYLLLNEDKRKLVCRNIYPVPDPRFPFLGVHFTPRVNGDIWLGPNAVIALAREGYKWSQINTKDCLELVKFAGLYKLCFRYIVPGFTEIVRSIYYPLALKETAKFIPCITAKDVKRGPSGVRAQALDNNGNLVDDFVFDTGVGDLGKRVLHCRNAPSPGATSSLAIASYISDKLQSDFKF